jgi:hypothetical protein
MSFGFDLGRLRSDSTGLSYVSRFAHSGGNNNVVYTSEAFAFATRAQAILLPQVDVPASVVLQFPTVVVTLNTSLKRIAVSVSGGNVAANILVFVG